MGKRERRRGKICEGLRNCLSLFDFLGNDAIRVASMATAKWSAQSMESSIWLLGQYQTAEDLAKGLAFPKDAESFATLRCAASPTKGVCKHWNALQESAAILLKEKVQADLAVLKGHEVFGILWRATGFISNASSKVNVHEDALLTELDNAGHTMSSIRCEVAESQVCQEAAQQAIDGELQELSGACHRYMEYDFLRASDVATLTAGDVELSTSFLKLVGPMTEWIVVVITIHKACAQ